MYRMVSTLCVAALCSVGSYGADVGDALREFSREVNKSLPNQIDLEKRLETSIVVGSTLIFKYKFTDETVIRNPRFDPKLYTKRLRESLGESTCKDNGVFELMQAGAKFNYYFVDAGGRPIIDFTLDSSTCRTFRPVPASASSAPILELVCVAPDGYSMLFVVDAASNKVTVNGVSGTNVLIDANEIMFTVELSGEKYFHMINRSTGALMVRTQAGVSVATHKCERARPKF